MSEMPERLDELPVTEGEADRVDLGALGLLDKADALRQKAMRKAKGLLGKRKQAVILEFYTRNKGKQYWVMNRPVGETGVNLDGGHYTCREGDIYLDELDDTFRIPLLEGLAHPPTAEDDPRFSPEQVRMRESARTIRDFVEASDEGISLRDFLFGAAVGGLIFYIIATVVLPAVL